MNKFIRNGLASAAILAAVAPGIAMANATWNVNYADAIAAGGLGGGAVADTFSPTSLLTDRYKFTAESLVVFQDNDNSGGISVGDTFDDYIAYRIDNLFLNLSDTGDPDYAQQNVNISGTVIASGRQVLAQDYLVDTASIEFYFDTPPGIGITNVIAPGDYGGSGTYADFTDLDTVYRWTACANGRRLGCWYKRCNSTRWGNRY